MRTSVAGGKARERAYHRNHAPKKRSYPEGVTDDTSPISRYSAQPMSLDLLKEKLQSVFKTMRGYGKISEANVADAVREVRLALLAADVNYQVAKDFCEQVKQKALGAEVLSLATGLPLTTSFLGLAPAAITEMVLTAKAMPDDQLRCIDAGANDYMAKPLDVEKLLSLVRVWMPR